MPKSNDVADSLAMAAFIAKKQQDVVDHHSIPDTNGPIDNIIGEVDPDTFKCHDCHQWLPISELSNHEFVIHPHCKKCLPPLDYSKLAMPLMIQTFPKMIAKDLITVQPMPSPNEVSAFFKKVYK